MSWESRNETGRYYTRSRRVDGRIVREYCGSGIVGELEYQQDLERREEREVEVKSLLAIQQSDIERDRTLDSFERLADCLARAALLASGYHQHKRGEWRKRK